MVEVCPRIRAVLFDVGGTLVYEPDFGAWAEQARDLSLDMGPDALSQAYLEILMEGDPRNQARDAGTAVVDFWRRALSRATREEVLEATATRFVVACGGRAAPVQVYADTRPCLNQLRDDRRILGVISNSNSEEVVRFVLGWADILDYFDCIVSSGSEGVEKPDREIFLRTVRRMGVAPAEAVYVGNKVLTDAAAAQSAGLYGVWVNREQPTRSKDPPEIASLLDVPACVQRIEHRLAIV